MYVGQPIILVLLVLGAFWISGLSDATPGAKSANSEKKNAGFFYILKMDFHLRIRVDQKMMI